MGDKGNPGAAETAGRRSSRVAIAIPISISGKDAADIAFKEKARTIVINKHGAKVSTFHHLALGTELTVENQLLGRSAQATVVWLGDRRAPKGPMEIGIQLAEAQNLWGIELPPEDWQEGPPIGPGGQTLEEAFAQKSRKSEPLSKPPAASPPRATPAQPGLRSAKPDTRAEAGFEERIRVLEEQLAKLSGQVGAGTSGNAPASVIQRGEEVLQSLDRRVDEVVGLLEAYRSEFGTSVARADEIRRSTHDEIDQARSGIRSAAAEALEKAVGDLREKLRPELESALQAAQEKSAKDAEYEFQKLAKESLANVLGDVRKAAEEARNAIMGELKASRQAVLDESRKSLAALNKEAMDSFTKEAKTVEKEYPVQLLQKLKEYQDKMVHELETHLHKALEKQRQAVLKQVQKVGEESAERAVAQVRAGCELAVKSHTDALQSRIADQSRSVLEGLRKESEGLLNRVRSELEQATARNQEQSMKAATANLQVVTDKLLDESAALLRKQADENMDLFADQLNEVKTKLVRQLSEETLRQKAGKPSLAPSGPVGGKNRQA